jgi:hypothetical protein
MESVGDFPVGHAGTLVEIDDSCLGVGTQLTLSRARRIAGLERMSATVVLATRLAVAAVDKKLAGKGLTGNFRLELLVEMILDDIATAIGAMVRQRCVEGLIDFLGRWWRPMAVLAMLLAPFAARFFGFGLGFTLGEGSRLPFGSAFGFLETFLKIPVGQLQLLDKPVTIRELLAKLLDFEKQLWQSGCVHANLDSDEPCQLSRIIWVFTQAGKGR